MLNGQFSRRRAARHPLLAGVVMGSLCLCGPLSAQEFQSDAVWKGFEAGLDMASCPSFGDTLLTPVDLIAAHVVPMLAGGPVDASALGEACSGHVAAEPDYRVQLCDAAARLQIAFTPESADDHTTLVINGPDGRWHCGGGVDDRAQTEFRLVDASAGQYDIWVGSGRAGQWVRGELRIGGRPPEQRRQAATE
jgi:hypothetical protein